MRKVTLRMNEQKKYEVIKKLVETNGNKKRAAVELECSLRTINRLILKYNTSGKKAFIHGNRNRKPAITFDDETRSFIVNLYKSEYTDTNYTHFCELLYEDHNLSLSSTTLHNWLWEEHYISPKAKRKTKKSMKKKIKNDSQNALTKKNRMI